MSLSGRYHVLLPGQADAIERRFRRDRWLLFMQTEFEFRDGDAVTTGCLGECTTWI